MEDGMVRIYLGGALGQKFGKQWNLYVRSPAEAIKAININTKGKFKEYLTKQGHNKFYKVCLDNHKNILDRMELGNSVGERDVYIVPVARGRKSGFGKIIAGIILIAAAYFSGGLSSGAGGLTAQIASGLVQAGIGLILGGIVQLLTPVQDFNANQDASTTAGSNIFQGNALAIAQGGPVSLVYGRALVAPMPISIAFNNFDQSPNFGGSNGGSDNNPGDGGRLGGPLDNFPGGTYFPYDVNTDLGTGVISYNQSTIPVVVRPTSY